MSLGCVSPSEPVQSIVQHPVLLTIILLTILLMFYWLFCSHSTGDSTQLILPHSTVSSPPYW